MVSKRNKQLVLKKAQIDGIKKWLGYGVAGSHGICPFDRSDIDESCETCWKIFPEMDSEDTLCPCHALSDAYVRETAKRLVNNFKHDKLIQSIKKILNRRGQQKINDNPSLRRMYERGN